MTNYQCRMIIGCSIFKFQCAKFDYLMTEAILALIQCGDIDHLAN